MKDFSDTSVKILAFGAQNITKEPHWHSPAQLPSSSFNDSVHCVTNAAAYCLASILFLGCSNHYPHHLRRVWLAPSPPRPFFTLLANSGNFLDISFILQCVLRVGCDNISDWSILRKIRFVVLPSFPCAYFTQNCAHTQTHTCIYGRVTCYTCTRYMFCGENIRVCSLCSRTHFANVL